MYARLDYKTGQHSTNTPLKGVSSGLGLHLQGELPEPSLQCSESRWLCPKEAVGHHMHDSAGSRKSLCAIVLWKLGAHQLHMSLVREIINWQPEAIPARDAAWWRPSWSPKDPRRQGRLDTRAGPVWNGLDGSQCYKKLPWGLSRLWGNVLVRKDNTLISSGQACVLPNQAHFIFHCSPLSPSSQQRSHVTMMEMNNIH